MKPAIIITFTLILTTQQIFAQTFRGTPVRYSDQALSEVLKNYQVYELPAANINEYVHTRQFAIPLTLEMGSQVFQWTLYENHILNPEAKGTTMKDGSIVPLQFNRDCRTFVGYNHDLSVDARFTIRDKTFVALMPDGEDTYIIQPVSQWTREAAENKFVMYRLSDLIAVQPGLCHVSKKEIQSETHPEPSDTIRNKSRGSHRTFSCLELQVSFATDNQMWQDYEDVDLILDFNLTVMNVMEPFYDDFDLDFWVAEFFIVTDPANSSTPWGNATEVDDLRPDFGDWAGAYFSTQDIGHLWTTNDLHSSGDYGVIGNANIGGTCGDVGIYQWAVLERFTANEFYMLALLQAHEYGHLLDADHEENTGTIMEPSINLVESATWAQANIDEMFDFIEDEACIQSCVQCPLSYTIIDSISWGDWKYSTVLHLNSSAGIDGEADVIFQSEGFVKLTPGFRATSLLEPSDGATFV
ncbi:MAG TPA: M12 family metallo-peptidase, partial [Saprospiraceae bacterium]|nr:M12 family metallo-peptidase [Saprospiraceae bacterium]